MLRTGLRIPSPLTPCYFHLGASFISRLANTDDIDRPIYGLSAQLFRSKYPVKVSAFPVLFGRGKKKRDWRTPPELPRPGQDYLSQVSSLGQFWEKFGR